LYSTITNFSCTSLPPARLARIEKEAGIKPAAEPAAAATTAGKPAKGSSSSGSGKGGAKFAGLLDELLEGDFDPEEYDRRMAEAFDDEYYEVRGWAVG
jgi:hypothetical protein